MSTIGTFGQYTLAWDGVGLATITVTASGLFVTSYNAESFQQAIQAPELQELLQTTIAPLPLALVATTGVGGFALQNGTPTILSWTAPNDGNLHRVNVFATLTVTSAETGGAVRFTYSDPLANAASITPFAGGAAASTYPNSPIASPFIAGANTQVAVKQNTALTVGAAVLWAEIWAS